MTLTRAEQKRQTRELLIQTATQLFTEKGFLQVSTAEVAKAAGVSHGTVFLHFPMREALLVAVIESFGNQVARRIHELVRDGEGLEGILRAHLSSLREFEGFYKRLVAETPLLPDEARDVLIFIQSAISQHLSLVSQREISAGRIKTLPFHFLFNLWLGLIHHYLANADAFAPGGSVIERHGEELLANFISLLSTNKQKGEPINEYGKFDESI